LEQELLPPVVIECWHLRSPVAMQNLYARRNPLDWPGSERLLWEQSELGQLAAHSESNRSAVPWFPSQSEARRSQSR
jgi:hypothetical protein